MHHEVFILTKIFPTLPTFVKFVSTVISLMYHKLSTRGKDFAAYITFVSVLYPLLILLISVVGRAFTTFITLTGLLPSVDPLMGYQV